MAERPVRLVALGSLDLDAAELGAHPVWLAAGRMAVTTAIDTLTVVRLVPELPVVATTKFSGGMHLPDEPFDPYELDFDRVGIHGAALHPDGTKFAIAGVTDDEQDRAVYVFTIEGDEVASVTAIDATGFDLSEDFLVCPIALAWAAGGESLVMCCSIENEHHVLTLAAKDGLPVTGALNLGGGFPEPVVVAMRPHPTIEAAVFQFACGQDGVWLRAVARGDEGLRSVAMPGDGDAWTTSVFGFTNDGVLCTGEGMYHRERLSSVCTRRWSDLASADATVEVGGFCHGGVVLGDRVGVVVADGELPYDRWPRPEQRLVLIDAKAGAVIGSAPLPEDHVLVAGDDAFIVTRAGDRVTAWRVEVG